MLNSLSSLLRRALPAVLAAMLLWLAPAAAAELPYGQGQPMPVGGDHPQLLVLYREEDPVQGVAALVVGDLSLIHI